MKKICFFVDSIFTLGGIQRIVTNICNELCNDYNITIICQYDTKNSQKINYNLSNNVNVKIIDNSFYGIDKIIFAPIRFLRFTIRKLKLNNKLSKKIMNYEYKIVKNKRLLRYFDKEKFDYILSEGLNNCIYISKLKKNINSPIIGCWHSSFENYILLYDNDSIEKSLKVLDKTIVLSQHDKKMIKKRFNVDVEYIYNFIDSNRVNNSSLNNNVFLAVGRYSKEKGYDRLIKIFSCFNSYNKNWKLYIVGDGPEKEKLQSLIDELKLSDKVILTGKTNNIDFYYNEASILLLTSYFEGFPMIVLEAMKYGLPIIAYDLPILKEILPKNNAIVDQDDIDKYVLEMNRFANNKELRTTIGKNNIIKCRDFYKDKIINKWNNILKG